MAKQIHHAATSTLKKQPQAPVKISHLFLLIAYGFVTVLTPNLMALDSNGPKFLTLAILNLATFLFLFTGKELKNKPEWYFAFFRNGIGLAYCGLMVVSLLSFFKAINVLESMVHFSKIFTTFSAAYLVTILVLADKRNIRYLCVALTLLLIYDSMNVFTEINRYIDGKLTNITDIKSSYSNKNILASSVFVKIPFALWLMVFSRNWLRILGMLGTFLAITATFFLSTRAFYLGTFASSILLILYFVILFIKSKDKYQLRLGGIYLILLFSALLIFSVTQRYVYPKTNDERAVGVGDRLSTITDGTGGGRFDAWKRSWHVFKEEPVLGVGAGNWKIATLKEENLTSPDYIYFFKVHNDFIEITTETGIFGGLFFIAIFLITGWLFVRILYKNSDSEWPALLFLPAFGLLYYSFDALFNFPQDRPEIQALFALYIGMMIAFIALYRNNNAESSQHTNTSQSSFIDRFIPFLGNKSQSIQSEKSNSSLPGLIAISIFGLALTASIYILYLNFDSLKMQRIVFEEIKSKKLKQSASKIINGFPAIPDLTQYGEPVAVQKARYLINENRNKEAIELLRGNKSNPYDSRPEYFIAQAYNNLKNNDSSMVYLRKVYNMKPNFFQNLQMLCQIMEQKGMQKEGEALLDKYLSKTKTNQGAWLYTSNFYDKSGSIQKAVSVIDSAAHYFPADTLVKKQKIYLDRKAIIGNNQALYEAAVLSFNAKKYSEALLHYSALLSKEPNFSEARINRAFCYFYLNEYVKSNLDIDYMISIGNVPSVFYNLRGVNFNYLGDHDKACKNFKIAADMGDKDGKTNYAKICQTPAK